MKITETVEKVQRPIRILQFGEGNFLRAFIEEFVDDANRAGTYDGSVRIVKPRPGGDLSDFRQQNSMYTLIVKGIKEGSPCHQKKVITAIESVIKCDQDYDLFLETAALPSLEVIVSNTTEAGICVNRQDQYEQRPPQTFPGKLTRFLYQRFLDFEGSHESGLLILPLELNQENGKLLETAILAYIEMWDLPQAFQRWVRESNQFCSTLVDRIVSGFSQEPLPYDDSLLDVCEPYRFLAIETSEPDQAKKRFPAIAKHPDVVFTEDLSVYRDRKVKILNGLHTAVSLAAYTAGYTYVREFMKDDLFLLWIKKMVWGEIIPTIQMDEKELSLYAKEVLQRFKNPFLHHRLLDISINSIAKWQVRVLPTILQYQKQYSRLPKHLVFSLAALLFFYEQGAQTKDYALHDAPEAIKRFETSASVNDLLKDKALWGENLSFIEGLIAPTAEYLEQIRKKGMKGAMESLWR